MRTNRRPSDSPGPGGNDPADRTRRPDKGDGVGAAAQFTPQTMAGNTLMDGAASQVGGNTPPPNFDLCGPDDPEDEEDD